MDHQALIDQYLAGSDAVQQAIAGMTEEQLDARSFADKWSTRQVTCHLADFEPIYADRMNRVIAERCPTFFRGNPDTFAASLSYDCRPVEAELALVTAVRRHMTTILRQLRTPDFQRTGNHSEIGALTLKALLRSITSHIPHHIQFINDKRRVLGV